MNKPWISDMIGELPGKYFGFIYKIINKDTGRIYIGRKNFYTRRKRRFGKKEIAQMEDKRGRKYEWVVKESNWREYISSNKELQEDIKNGCNYSKYILKFVENESEMTYWETKFQFMYGVLENDTYNDNILGKFYRKIFDSE